MKFEVTYSHGASWKADVIEAEFYKETDSFHVFTNRVDGSREELPTSLGGDLVAIYRKMSVLKILRVEGDAGIQT